MPSPIKMRTDYSAPQLRVLAKNAKTNSQSRRLLSLAAVLDGMNRADAACIGGMDRQTFRDWVHRFNQLGPDGLCDVHAGGVEPRLSADQKAELAALVDAGPDLSVDGVVRWRCSSILTKSRATSQRERWLCCSWIERDGIRPASSKCPRT